jgi:hypothetical protein
MAVHPKADWGTGLRLLFLNRIPEEFYNLVADRRSSNKIAVYP